MKISHEIQYEIYIQSVVPRAEPQLDYLARAVFDLLPAGAVV